MHSLYRNRTFCIRVGEEDVRGFGKIFDYDWQAKPRYGTAPNFDNPLSRVSSLDITIVSNIQSCDPYEPDTRGYDDANDAAIFYKLRYRLHWLVTSIGKSGSIKRLKINVQLNSRTHRVRGDPKNGIFRDELLRPFLTLHGLECIEVIRRIWKQCQANNS